MKVINQGIFLKYAWMGSSGSLVTEKQGGLSHQAQVSSMTCSAFGLVEV